MKTIKTIIYCCAFILLGSCKEGVVGQYPIDSTPPGAVANVKIKNMPGSVDISYRLPEDEDLLYVKALYQLDNGTSMEVKASAYTNKMTLVGFGKAGKRDVKLITVDMSQNESEIINIVVDPKESPIYDVYRSLKAANDFGGILLNWKNPEKVALTITVTTPNIAGKDSTVARFYNGSSEGIENVRGFDTTPRKFSITINDRWGNKTQTLTNEFRPIYEELIKRSFFKRWNPSDIPYQAYNSSFNIENLWDGILGTNETGKTNTGNGWSTRQGGGLSNKLSYDICYGHPTARGVILSRFKVHLRALNEKYTGGGPKRFAIYGATRPDVSITSEDPETQWKLVGEYTFPKPSGYGNPTTVEDVIFAGYTGADFPVVSGPEMRYFRFDILEDFAGNKNPTAFVISEITFYGSYVNN